MLSIVILAFLALPFILNNKKEAFCSDCWTTYCKYGSDCGPKCNCEKPDENAEKGICVRDKYIR